jgi:hypothetical protein
MTILYHQTFSPSNCECVIEQQFEHDEETGLNGEPTLWFFHTVCARHESLVKNKPKLSEGQLKQKRDQIRKHHEFLLSENRNRHLKTFNEHPIRKQKKDAIMEMKLSKDTEKYALVLEAQMDGERVRTEGFLDNHELESMGMLLAGLHSPYAFGSESVYDAIMKEQRDVNPIIENDG